MREREYKSEKKNAVLFSVLSSFHVSENVPSNTTDAEFFPPNSAESSDRHLSYHVKSNLGPFAFCFVKSHYQTY